MGVFFKNLGQFEKAETFYRKSLEFFTKMQGQATDSKLNLFASHPLTTERLEDLKKLQASYKGVTPAK